MIARWRMFWPCRWRARKGERVSRDDGKSLPGWLQPSLQRRKLSAQTVRPLKFISKSKWKLGSQNEVSTQARIYLGFSCLVLFLAICVTQIHTGAQFCEIWGRKKSQDEQSSPVLHWGWNKESGWKKKSTRRGRRRRRGTIWVSHLNWSSRSLTPSFGFAFPAPSLLLIGILH